MPDLSALDDLHGNWKLLLLVLGADVDLAAFGEEMVYRGYLMNRVAGLLRNPKIAWTLSLIVVSFVFGLAHIDQGITGQVENMINGLLLGVIFLATGCNMWAAIIAHGVTDTRRYSCCFIWGSIRACDSRFSPGSPPYGTKSAKNANSRPFRINGLGGNCSHDIDTYSSYTYPLVAVGVSRILPGLSRKPCAEMGIVKERICARTRRGFGQGHNDP